MAARSVWIVTRDWHGPDPIVGVFSRRDEAMAYVDEKISERPEDVYEIGCYPIGVPLY